MSSKLLGRGKATDVGSQDASVTALHWVIVATPRDGAAKISKSFRMLKRVIQYVELAVVRSGLVPSESAKLQGIFACRQVNPRAF